MSGITSNRVKKNFKKSKIFNGSEVVEVKSVKLEPRRPFKETRNIAKSEDNLIRRNKKSSKNQSGHCSSENKEEVQTELETHILRKIKKLSLKSENAENSAPSTSGLSNHNDVESKELKGSSSAEVSCNTAFADCAGSEANVYDPSELSESYVYTHRYYPKKTKSIKFINQVTVLYFNGDDILYESMEPLKKEVDQQLRNREMRKEHLMRMGHEIDNLYLF